MKNIKENFKDIFENHKGLLSAQIFLLVVSIALLIFSMLNMISATSIVKTSYGDIGRYQGGEWSSMANSGGYRDGSWINMFSFSLLALVFGLLHNLLIVKIYSKRGDGMARAFAMMSISLVLAILAVIKVVTGLQWQTQAVITMMRGLSVLHSQFSQLSMVFCII